MKKFLALLLALIMVFSLAACGAKEAPAPAEEPAEKPAEEPAEEPTESTGVNLTDTEKVEGAEYKEDVVIGMASANVQMDIQEVTGTSDYTSHQLSHDTLFKTDEDTGELLPWLCESYEVDGATWTLKLREDVKFHDGTTFDAYDVEFTLERGLNHTQTQGFYSSLTWEVVDDYTIKLATAEPNMDLGFRMANIIFGSMLSKESCEADPDNGFNIGTGAFKFVEFMENSYVKYEASDNYWGDPVNCKTIELRYYAEPSARLIALQNGEIDVCFSPTPTELQIVKDDSNLELIEMVGGMSTYLSFNTLKEPYNNADFRRAIAYSIDRDAVIEIVCDGYGTISNSIYGPNSVACADDILEGHAYDLEKAKELVAANGWEGMELTILTPDFVPYSTTAVAIQPMLTAAGFKVNIEQRGLAEFNAIQDKNEHTISLGGFSCSDYPDSYKSACYSTGAYNFSRFADPEIDEKLERGLTITDWDERLAVYHDVAKTVFDEECYYACLFRENANIAMAKGVSGFYARCDLIVDFTNISVPVR